MTVIKKDNLMFICKLFFSTPGQGQWSFCHHLACCPWFFLILIFICNTVQSLSGTLNKYQFRNLFIFRSDISHLNGRRGRDRMVV